MSIRSLSGAIALLLASLTIPARPQAPTPAPETPAAAADEAAMRTGRELSRLFLQGDTDAVWARMTPAMQSAIGDAAALAQFRQQVRNDLGAEETLLDESGATAADAHVYARTSRWSKLPAPVLMQWVMDDAGKVAGFVVQPKPQAAPSPHMDYRTKARLRLPFEGPWYVVWGGRSIEQNYHAASPGQRFAYDLVKRIDGRSHRGDGSVPEDYYCWNAKILAPADGAVLEAVDGLPDQAIGARDTQHIAGNHVMLDLGNGEYALLAHLRRGSVAVKAGEAVAAGDEIGRCGNSGNSSEPHLHFHLQDAPEFGRGNGLPAFFEHYVVDGSPVTRGEPVQGQVIAPARSAATPPR